MVSESVELNNLSACRAQMAVMMFGEQPLDETCSVESMATSSHSNDGTFLADLKQTTQIPVVGNIESCTSGT
eukprot:8988345-Lingulodinium_polyedra.AAC.1